MLELNVGEKSSETVSFTTEQIRQFSEISGDKNPVHLDAEFAIKSGFKKCIVPGMLACSVFSKIIANNFPGAGSVYLSSQLLLKMLFTPMKNVT